MRTEGSAISSGRDQVLAIYHRALPRVYGYLLPRCGDAALAEDLTAETFLAAVAAADRPDSPEVSVAWQVGVARHKLVDHWCELGREQRALTRSDLGDEAVDDPWDAVVDASAGCRADRGGRWCPRGDRGQPALDAVRDGGRAISIVFPGAPAPLERGITGETFPAHVTRQRLEALRRLVDAGTLRPQVETVLPLNHARDALARVAARHTRGKIVLQIG
jgi:Zinc-binding dehydrogenase/Sigma-70 region 2